MKKHHLLPLLLLPLLLTGCGEEHISDRIYTQTLGLTGDTELTLYAQAFGKETRFSSEGSTAAEALRNGEASQGGRILIGHTELLCMDGSCSPESLQDLLFSQGLSPACKLLYTQVDTCFRNEDTALLLKSIRMAEKDGLIAETDLSTVLNEWLGASETALLPAVSGDKLRMVLLHTDGTRILLSEEAACGMYWLRRSGEDFTMTIQWEEGTEDVSILRSSLRKDASFSDGKPALCYILTVYTDDCPDGAKQVLQEEILQQCCAAVSEMLNADADVIGMQELRDFAGIASEDAAIEIEVLVK